MVALSCPHCGNKKEVIKFGTNRSGTARCRCRACKKTFTPVPKSRALTPEKEAAIEGALSERVSQQGIARMLKVSRNTIRTVRKKGRNV
jgi:transposase-like protein